MERAISRSIGAIRVILHARRNCRRGWHAGRGHISRIAPTERALARPVVYIRATNCSRCLRGPRFRIRKDRLVDARRTDEIHDELIRNLLADVSLAGRTIVETHNHGGIGNDDGIAPALRGHLEPAFDRGDHHRSIRQLFRDR